MALPGSQALRDLMPTDWVDIQEVIDYLGADAPASDDAAGQARLADSITSASELLYGLSGRKFAGELQSVVLPQAQFEPRHVTVPTWPSSSWGICFGQPHVMCIVPRSIGLGRSPIVSINSVTIDDTVLDPTEYRIDDKQWLTRLPCCVGWPMCGCGCDSFVVDFQWGQDPPQMGVDAATVVSAEMYRAKTPGMNCKLPARLTSITRQGVSMALIDPMDFIKEGKTGIYQVDMFLQAYNPARQIKPPLVFSPDISTYARRPS